MNILILIVMISCNVLLSIHSFSQQQDDVLIRKLEDAERQAILKSDTVQLSKLMSRKIVVQNPENAIVGYNQIMDRIKSGKINYSIFERRIDTISFINGIAIVMGEETLIPKTDTQPGKILKRRFTNMWTKENGSWQLTARQATIVSAN
jgi:hypothetical protein